MRHILVITLSFLLIVRLQAIGFVNPISPYGPEDFANPGVVYANGYYYAVHSENNCSQIVVYKSTRLENLYYSPKVVVWTAPAGTDHSEAIWAPYLQYIQGNWYIYYTATWGGILEYHRMFVLKGNTQDPQGSYTDCGSIYAANTDFYAIDGKVITKPSDGSLYFVWSGSPGLPYQHIYLAPMDSPTHINGPAVKISGGIANWENAVHEAPAFIYKNGKSIIVYSTGELLNPGPAGYKMGTLTNTDGDYLNANSWIKSLNPVFQHWNGVGGSVYAPGACCFVKSPDATEDWMIYHAKHFNDYNYNREIRAQKFTWDANDNPLFDHPIPSGITLAVPSGQDPSPEEIISGGVYKIVAQHSLKALTVRANSTVPGALIEQNTYAGAENQKWVITNVDGKYYKIISLYSGLSLNVANYSVDNGVNIIQQVYTGYDDELWRIDNLGNENYVITAKHSQKVLDVVRASLLDGSQIIQWPFLGNTNQKWQLIRITSPLSSQADLDIIPKADRSNFKLYPIPAKEKLYVEAENAIFDTFEIYDLAGRKLKTASCSTSVNRLELDVSNIAAGIYFIEIRGERLNFVKQIRIYK